MIFNIIYLLNMAGQQYLKVMKRDKYWDLK